MKLDNITLRLVHLDLIAPFETSFGRTTSRKIILVEVVGDGAAGWGECTAPEAPLFNEEFTEGAWEVLTRFLIPAVLEAEFDHPADVPALFAPVRGHRMAKAALETAIWDLAATVAGVPLWRFLGGPSPEINCGVSIGLQTSIDVLLEKVERELAAGYQRIKIKIAPGRDLVLVEAVRKRFGGITLSVDANAAYTLSDIDLFVEMDRFGLLMIEQPLRPGDLIDHARLQGRLETALCLDESIVDCESARQAIGINACRIVNIKLGRVGGHAVSRRIARTAAEAGVAVWCGGMLEAGIGRLQNAAMATGSAFTLPGDVSDSRRYWTRDIVDPRPSVDERGVMTLSNQPGIGANVDLEFVEAICSRRALFQA